MGSITPIKIAGRASLSKNTVLNLRGINRVINGITIQPDQTSQFVSDMKFRAKLRKSTSIDQIYIRYY